MSDGHGLPEAGTPGLTIALAGAGLDELRNLRSWLVQEDELRGRVALVQEIRAPGTLGGAAEVLSVSLGSGGAISVLVAGTVSWLRQRYGHRPGSTVTVKLRRADGGSFELTASAVRAWTPAEITDGIRKLAETLDPGDSTRDPGELS
jgi:Effector Associated Constant Component 1